VGYAGEVTIGDQAPRILYRAVFGAELEDWRQQQRLRCAPGGMEGKHFAETYPDAVRFGRMLQQFEEDGGPCHVLRVTFHDVADIPCHDERADRIGPAYLASANALGVLPLEAER
jgi:hypothetical protein